MPPSTIPKVLPDSFFAGDTLYFIVPATSRFKASDGWSLVYEFSTSGPSVITSSASSDDFLLTVANTSTASWTAGDYTWHSYFTKTTGTAPNTTTERYSYQTGTFRIRTVAYKSTAKKMLDAIDSYLSGITSYDSLQWTAKSLGDQSVSRSENTQEIIKARAYWQTVYDGELKREIISAGGTTQNNTIWARFVK